MSTCTKLLELHYVLSQSSSLIAEDVGHCAELLIQVRGLALGHHVLLDVIHHPVLLNEVALEKLGDLKGHVQRYVHKVHEGQEPLHEANYVDLEVGISRCAPSVIKAKVAHPVSIYVDPNAVIERGKQTENELDEYN